MFERLIIGMLSIVGLLISAYFAVIYHKIIPTIDRYVPKFCRPKPTTCATVLETPQARLLGMPNFDLGILYYFSLLGSTILTVLWKQLHVILFAGSVATVVVGFYLSYVLFFQLRIRCSICIAGHAVNLMIFLFLLAAL